MPTAPNQRVLPEALRSRIRAFEWKLCRTEFTFAASVAIAVVVGAHLVLFASDRAWDTATWMRLLLAVTAAVTILLGAAFWARYWLIKRRDLAALATLIQRHHRQLGDRLQGIVELAEHGTPGESEALRVAAIQQVAAEAVALDFGAAVPTGATRRALRICLALAAIAVVGTTVAPQAFHNVSARLLSPLESIPRYTFTTLGAMPPHRIVAHGAPFVLQVPIDASSAYMPDFVHAEAPGLPHLTAVVRDGGATLQVPGAVSELSITVTGGDASALVRVTPLHPPTIDDLQAAVTLPDYLGRAPYTERVRAAGLRVVSGAQVDLTASANRALRAATINGEAAPVHGNQITLPRVAVNGPEQLTLSYIGRHGLTPPTPLLINLQAAVDQAPVLSLSAGERTVAILPDEVVRYAFTCTDDYGIDEVSLQHARETAEESGEPALAIDIVYGSPTTTLLRAVFSVSPMALGIQAGETVRVHAEAYDFYPDREASLSESLRIRVLSLEEHAELVRRGVDDLQADLEQLVRAQDSENNATQEQLDKPPSERDSEATSRSLEQQAERQEDNTATLAEMAQEAGELARQAMKNDEFSRDTVAQLAELAAEMQSTAKGAMQKASQALQKSSQQKGGARQEEMQEAAEQQEQAMKELQAMQEKLNDGVESMLAESFVNRLRQAAKVEREVSQGLQQDLSAAAGVRASDLPAGLARDRQEQQQTHEGNRSEVSYVQDDLAGFFNRTGREIYNEIYSNMTAEAVVAGLRDVTQLVSENRAFLAIDGSERWATRLDEWAALLAADNKRAREQPPSSGEPPPMTEDELAILLRLERARQREEAIRARTRRLDQVAEESVTYAMDTRALSREQYDLARDIIALERVVTHEQVARLVEVIGGEMLNVRVKLREPRTDQSTIAIQTEIIELLSSSMDQVMQQSAAAAALGQMMTMMGIMPGPGTGGAGPAGEGGNLDGDPDGEAGSVEKAGGIGGGVVPGEFQDALRGYLQQIEALQP